MYTIRGKVLMVSTPTYGLMGLHIFVGYKLASTYVHIWFYFLSKHNLNPHAGQCNCRAFAVLLYALSFICAVIYTFMDILSASSHSLSENIICSNTL